MAKETVKGQVAQKSKESKNQIWRPKFHNSKEKTVTVESSLCPYCKHDIKPGYAICPHCGRSLTPEKCSFCGASMKATARFCTKCGQSREGVICPECGTLNSRNFCRKCNAPLTEMARIAIAQAKNDPKFKALQKKAAELAELHAQIEEMQNTSHEEQAPAQLSDEDRALLDEYAAILGSIGAYKPKPIEKTPVSEPKRRQYSSNVMSLDEIMKAYREKAEEMNSALEALIPPPDFTPEQQRDYFSARKIATVVQEYDMSGYSPSMWKCNLCGALHPCPSDCAEPQLGGVWIYVTPEEYLASNPGCLKSTSLNIK